jgi:hypothetical protein
VVNILPLTTIEFRIIILATQKVVTQRWFNVLSEWSLGLALRRL